MKVTRRGVLKATAAAGAGLLLPLPLKTAANAFTATGITPFTEQLPTLAELGTIDAANGTATLHMVNATHSFHKNLANAPTFAYSKELTGVAGGRQDYLGPVIVAQRDVPFLLTMQNDLTSHPLPLAIDDMLVPAGSTDATTPRTSTHLHGANTDPANDGDPEDTFLPGGGRTYAYLNSQEAAGLWYHDHAIGITRLNVYAGLAGGYLIRDVNDPGDGSLLPADRYEVPLIVQDRSFNKDGSLSYPANQNPTTPRPWAPEFFGNVATVNGKAYPNMAVAKGKYRFRVYNGSNARFYNFRLMYGATALAFFQIGTDGGLLNNPVRLKSLLLAPGERADLVVDFTPLAPGAKVILTNNATTPYPNGPRPRRLGGNPLPQIMRFTVTTEKGWVKPLTAATNLRALTAPITRLADVPASGIAVRRSMTMVESLDAQGAPLMALMNNRSFMNPGAMAMEVKTDTLEQWDLINTTGDAHPMHLHFTQFQILNREEFDDVAYVAAAGYDGKEGSGPNPPPDVTKYLAPGPTLRLPALNEQGWKDTVIALPGEVTRILVPFGPNAVPGSPMAIGKPHLGDYVSHCHILEHEDNDMMMRFRIVE